MLEKSNTWPEQVFETLNSCWRALSESLSSTSTQANVRWLDQPLGGWSVGLRGLAPPRRAERRVKTAVRSPPEPAVYSTVYVRVFAGRDTSSWGACEHSVETLPVSLLQKQSKAPSWLPAAQEQPASRVTVRTGLCLWGDGCRQAGAGAVKNKC